MRAELRSRAVRDLLDAADLLAHGVEGQLVGGLFGGGEALGAEADRANPGALEAERLVQGVRRGGERRGVGGRLLEGAAAGGRGAVGVADGEGQGAADLLQG